MQIDTIFLAILGFLICMITFFGSVTLLGFVENKSWIKRVGVWSLLLIGFTFGSLFLIITPICMISTFFFF